ncbi:hypothetical protein BV97_02011 [Novosphingobium resinovorum]|uniref:Uncharacterized protein n=1 Tax=Novosphingobium resinovorum TaxID=158500 RepID=A0A031JYF4_9SPHN|nr:hypothetical protein BV97_02011 [Novosphingobium resinovorum]
MIVCIGWGSLIWCQKSLPVASGWQADGPRLPVEFARESSDKRITLVICERSPAVEVLWAPLDVATLNNAKQVLAAREGIRDHNIQYSIGYWSPAAASNHHGGAAIAQWAAARGFEGAVWTALKPRINGENRMPAEQEVIEHLDRLSGAARDVAEEYVRLAPRQIATSYRTAIEAAFGWTAAGLL